VKDAQDGAASWVCPVSTKVISTQIEHAFFLKQDSKDAKRALNKNHKTTTLAPNPHHRVCQQT
jgi:hypothetical protein